MARSKRKEKSEQAREPDQREVFKEQYDQLCTYMRERGYSLVKVAYDKVSEDMSKLDYSSAQCKKVIQRRFTPAMNVGALFMCHSALLAKGYTRDQIIRMASHNGGWSNIFAVITHHDDLVNIFCFNQEQITRIVSWDYGAHNIQNIIKLYKSAAESNVVAMTIGEEVVVKNIGFPPDFIEVAARSTGARNLEIMAQRSADLQKLGLKIEEIMRLAAHNGGANNLEALIVAYRKLRELGFSKEQILDISCRNVGAQNIKFIIDKEDKVKKCDLSIVVSIIMTARPSEHALRAYRLNEAYKAATVTDDKRRFTLFSPKTPTPQAPGVVVVADNEQPSPLSAVCC